MFSRAASRLHRDLQRDHAVNMRAAQYAEGDWTRYIKQLERDDDGQQ
jgi:hypothetical protein